MYTTLEKIRAQSPCADGWTQLLTFLGKTKADDEPQPLSVILESNGLDDTLWCFQAVDGFEREKRLYLVWCVRQVQHLMTDPRSLTAPDVAEKFANDLASAEELVAARDAAMGAAWDTQAAMASGWAASEAAAYTDCAAWVAAATTTNARAGWVVARAARAATRNATRASQTQELKRVLACTEAGIDPYPPKEKQPCSQQD